MIKTIALSFVLAGFTFAQNAPVAQQSDTNTKTEVKHHGKKVKTDSTTNTTVDQNGNVDRDKSHTTTKTKKHHGKTTSESKTTTSSTNPDKQQ